jgi:hypothetical protein
MAIELASWAQVVASIAVLATLVYLSIQTKQTNIMMQAETRQNLLENDVRSLLDFKDASGLMQKLRRSEQLTYEDQFRFSITWLVDMRNREFEYFQYKAGILDEETWQSYRTVILFSLGTKRYRKWWETIGRPAYSPGFAKMVDDLIEDAPENRLLESLGTWDD